jgi:cytochrome b involved in lipid metabolism
MKTLYSVATLLFWAALISLVAADPPAPAASAGIARIELARHDSAASCWMAIDGRVYDVTDYIDVHPADPHLMLKYCGRDSSQAFADKEVGRPHSARAVRLLERYLVGPLAADAGDKAAR